MEPVQGLGNLDQVAVALPGGQLRIVPGVPQRASRGDFLDQVLGAAFGEAGHDARQALVFEGEQASLPDHAGPGRTGGQHLGDRRGGAQWKDLVEKRQDVLAGILVGGHRFGDHGLCGHGRFLFEDEDGDWRAGTVAVIQAAKANDATALADLLAQLKAILEPEGGIGGKRNGIGYGIGASRGIAGPGPLQFRGTEVVTAIEAIAPVERVADAADGAGNGTRGRRRRGNKLLGRLSCLQRHRLDGARQGYGSLGAVPGRENVFKFRFTGGRHGHLFT